MNSFSRLPLICGLLTIAHTSFADSASGDQTPAWVTNGPAVFIRYSPPLKPTDPVGLERKTFQYYFPGSLQPLDLDQLYCAYQWSRDAGLVHANTSNGLARSPATSRMESQLANLGNERHHRPESLLAGGERDWPGTCDCVNTAACLHARTWHGPGRVK